MLDVKYLRGEGAAPTNSRQPLHVLRKAPTLRGEGAAPTNSRPPAPRSHPLERRPRRECLLPPTARKHAQTLLLANKPMQAVQGADALIIVTEWKAYRSPNWTALRAAMKAPVIFDGRNLYEPQAMQSSGMHYVAIGRGNQG